MKSRVYLDFSASAPVTPGALRAFARAIGTYGNPSAPHEEGRAARAILEKARSTIAHLAGSKPENLIFTSGATEANAIAIRGHVRAQIQRGKTKEQIHLLYTAGAHASVAEAMKTLREEGVATDEIPLTDGAIDSKVLQKLLRKETTLVSVEIISSETGLRFDTKEIRRILDTARKGEDEKIYLHVDASQLPCVESFERTRLDADTLSLDAQKVGGVRGIGCLIFSSRAPLASVIDGGGQERGLRSGTETPALASAFATALVVVAEKRERFVQEAEEAREWLAENICRSIVDTVVNEGKKNAPHILNVSFLGRDTDYLSALLDVRGFAVSTKSACETDSVSGSRIVQALSGDRARAISTLRISWGDSFHELTRKRFLRALKESVDFIDQNKL